MKIEIIPCLKDNYSYLIIDEKNKNACVVDPSEAQPIINYLDKNNIQLTFILNTHHHYDHVGGNSELKKKYNAKVVGYIYDTERIPDIDVVVKNGEIWSKDNFNAKIIHIPGHTLGHICFHFFNEKNIFTGDTLFSLGCGKIFEGTYLQMHESLNFFKSLPLDTKIYCGHEYTLQNSKFCIKYDSDNEDLKEIFQKIDNLRSNNLPTVPSKLGDELKANIFLRCDQNSLKIKLNMRNEEDYKVFKKVRDLKDSF